MLAPRRLRSFARAPQQKYHDRHIKQIPSRAVFAAEAEQASGTGPSTSSRQGLPRFVKEAFEAYLDCGILAHGFMRLRCEHCAFGGKLKLIAVLEEPDVIEKILKQIGLNPQPPPLAPARRRVDLFEVVEAA